MRANAVLIFALGIPAVGAQFPLDLDRVGSACAPSQARLRAYNLSSAKIIRALLRSIRIAPAQWVMYYDLVK